MSSQNKPDLLDQIKNKVAREKGYDDWETMENWFINHNFPSNIAVLLTGSWKLVCERYATAKAKALQDFKDYVHKRLDDAGIEKDPESEHKAAGCRIGGRLDIVLSKTHNRSQVIYLCSSDQKPCKRGCAFIDACSPVKINLPPAVVFNLQQIALADDDMVKQPGAAEHYRYIARHILELFKK